jgi:hypothetical protein
MSGEMDSFRPSGVATVKLFKVRKAGLVTLFIPETARILVK